MKKNDSTIRTLENGRASVAYKFAENGKSKPEGYEYKDTEYKSYVKKMSVLIKTNGLGQTLAFIKSKRQKEANKKKNAYDLIYSQIGEWLTDERCLVSGHLSAKEDNFDLVEKIISLQSPDYRAVTIEVLSFVNWLRRFADGLIEDEE